MFRELTTFVLGAGASVHYGYPVGEELVSEVKKKAVWFSEYCRAMIGSRLTSGLQVLANVVQEEAPRVCEMMFGALSQRIEQTDPVVIDYFLGQNPQLAGFGKFLIAWVLLEHESHFFRTGHFKNLEREKMRMNRENWLRFVVHQMLLDCSQSYEVLNNEVYFVTFNYDVSLEATLSQMLRSHEFMKGADITSFLNTRVVHIYGKLNEHGNFWGHDGFSENNVRNVILGDHRSTMFSTLIDHVFLASQGINVIDPLDKGKNEDAISAARNVVQQATSLYILGYGFDPNNSKRIGLESRGPQVNYRGGRRTYFTNFGDSNRINKAAGLLFARDPSHFLSPSGVSLLNTPGHYVEKSVSTTYDALAKDFEV